MLGRPLASPLWTFDSSTHLSFTPHDLSTASPIFTHLNANLCNVPTLHIVRGSWSSQFCSNKKWVLRSTAEPINSLTLSDEERKTWEASREALSVFNFSVEEKDKMLGKAFGHIQSPYWGEEREKEVPKFEVLNAILDYIRSLGLSDEDLHKLLKKFPELLGCSLENELQNNVKILEKDWGIKGKSLRNLLLRNPKVLGYNVDCKGDCMAQCTRCWVRF